MSIGYACHSIALPGSDIKSCTLKNATEEHLLSLIGHNLNSLETAVDYNIRNGIRIYRISSDLIPFGSSIASGTSWQRVYAAKLKSIGERIIAGGLRVSMHPGQYTVLNSPDASVAERAVLDLDYHTTILDSMGLASEHKIVLHLGGAYGNKKQAIARFVSRCKELALAVHSRLVLENDDTLFNIQEVLEAAYSAEIPVVYDNLHNAVNPADTDSTDIDWIRRCSGTWRKRDGLQKIHYAQQHSQKKPGAHSESIYIDRFLEFYRQLSDRDIDIMLEVKDKNISALKCINCVSNRGINALEAEWARYKYGVLERSPNAYQAIRQLLRNKSTYPAVEMYRMIEKSYSMPIAAGNAVNAAQHVWGYFKDKASEPEKKQFQSLMAKAGSSESGVLSIKNYLLRLALKYHEAYLLNGYYLYKS